MKSHLSNKEKTLLAPKIFKHCTIPSSKDFSSSPPSISELLPLILDNNSKALSALLVCPLFLATVY